MRHEKDLMDYTLDQLTRMPLRQAGTLVVNKAVRAFVVVGIGLAILAVIGGYLVVKLPIWFPVN